MCLSYGDNFSTIHQGVFGKGTVEYYRYHCSWLLVLYCTAQEVEVVLGSHSADDIDEQVEAQQDYKFWKIY